MKKGIIMEINERFLTVLTPEGEFLRAHKQQSNYQIGQQIDFTPVEIVKKQPFYMDVRSKVGIIVAAALLFLTFFIFPFNGNQKVFAYISIDINPSIELGVNDEFQVIELIPYNQDGKKIVKEIDDWKNQDVQVVTNAIMDQIKDQGYFKENHDVVISTVLEEEQEKALDTQWDQKLNEIKEVIQDRDLNLTLVEGSPKDRQIASEKGMTTGSIYKEKQLNKATDNALKENKVDKSSPITEGNENLDESNQKEESKKENPKDIVPGQLKKEENAIKDNQNKGNSISQEKKNNTQEKNNRIESKMETPAQNKNSFNQAEKRNEKNNNNKENKQNNN